MKASVLLLLPLLAAVVLASSKQNNIASARVESCSGWRLNKLPEVKKFIFEDLEQYEDTIFKKIPGHIPELVLLDAEDNEIERIDLSEKSREQCNELLTSRGFQHKAAAAAEEAAAGAGEEL